MFSVFGSTGLIGTALCAALRSAGETVFAPGRSLQDLKGNLGHVIYCIGDDRFDVAPFMVVDTHVSMLSSLLQRCDYESFLYLSTTRIYMDGPRTDEAAPVSIDLSKPSYLFNLSKLTGEALCLALKNEKVRVARLSNVTGVNPHSHLFLPTVIRNALEERPVELDLTPDSAKDYILLEDAVEAIVKIARAGAHRIYNVASGRNTTAGEIVKILQRETECEARWSDNPVRTVFTPIDIALIGREFGFSPTSVSDCLPDIIEATRRALRPAC